MEDMEDMEKGMEKGREEGRDMGKGVGKGVDDGGRRTAGWSKVHANVQRRTRTYPTQKLVCLSSCVLARLSSPTSLFTVCTCTL